jgi:hypothetical protein
MADLDRLFEAPGMSPDQAIREYIRQDSIIKDAAYDRNAAKSVIVAEAGASRNGTLKTVHVETADQKQKVKVEFGIEYRITDAQQMEVVKELLGETRFNEIFKVEYTPKSRAFQSFLNTSSGDERFRSAREIVKEIVKEQPKTPSVTVERA